MIHSCRTNSLKRYAAAPACNRRLCLMNADCTQCFSWCNCGLDSDWLGGMQSLVRSHRIFALLLLPVTLLTCVSLVRHALPPKSPTKDVLWPRTSTRTQLLSQQQSSRRDCKFCQNTPDISVTIVAARSNEDTSWLDVYLGRIRHLVYQVIDANAEYTTTVNKGKEAMPYLQYIIDQYDQLPDVSVFTHGAM